MVLTSTLLTEVRDDIKDQLETLFTHGAVGTASPTPAASDTALGGEVFRDSIDDFDKSVSNAVTASLRISTTEANGETLRENGWFNASSGGDMWTRNTFSAINKTSDVQLFLDTTITIAVTEA